MVCGWDVAGGDRPETDGRRFMMDGEVPDMDSERLFLNLESVIQGVSGRGDGLT